MRIIHAAAYKRLLHPLEDKHMDENKRLQKVWRTLISLAHGYFERRFKFTCEKYELDGPALIIGNHVTNWDPLLLALSFPKNHIHFVASEHLFRLGWVSKLISFLVAPIPRRKGASGAATTMDCLRKMRAGRTVCIYGEGETTWDGRTKAIFPATGTLARASGATLITYRLEGGYLTAPRWAKKNRRGRMRGYIVNRYTPDQLKLMKPQEIEEIINRDIYEDEWARQKADPVKYKGKNLAKDIEVAVFLCPKCKKIGTIHGEGNTVSCECGLKLNLNEYGTFEPAEPFENMAQWNDWQHKCLKDGDFVHGDMLFSDPGMTLYFYAADAKKGAEIANGSLSIANGAMHVGSRCFPLAEINDMALIQRKKLCFMHGEDYYEIKADKPSCLRKYLAVWQNETGRENTK